MKILFVCHRLPFPPNRGGKIRPFNMIRHLSGKHQVVVGSLAHTDAELQEGAGLKDHCAEVLAEVVPNYLRWAQAGRALLTSQPSSVAYFWSRSLRRKIDDAAQRIGFDVVMVHCAFAAQYAQAIPAKFRLLDFGDLDSGKWFDYKKFRAFPLCHGYGLEAFKLRRYERKLAQDFDCCTVTTPGELEEFAKLRVDRQHAVIPNGVDGDYFHGEQQNCNLAPVVTFVGRMDYFPNIDGILYFANAIFPRIRQAIPTTELRVVGSNPTVEILNLAKMPGITVTGHVSDVRPYLKDAAVTVAPLRLARGTQNKILESMAMGVPVVATPQAAKGIMAVPGKHLLVAGEPDEFAHAVVGLMRDSVMRRNFSEAGRSQVFAAHAWPQSMKILDGILDQVRLDG